MSCFRSTAWTRSKYVRGGTSTPPVPMTGSAMKALIVSGPSRSMRASSSPTSEAAYTSSVVPGAASRWKSGAFAGGSGKDTITHPRGGHDDVANATAGALVRAARTDVAMFEDLVEVGRQLAAPLDERAVELCRQWNFRRTLETALAVLGHRARPFRARNSGRRCARAGSAASRCIQQPMASGSAPSLSRRGVSSRESR
jgi:hypothetical protein